ncbi:glycosyltransferase [uncultured Selenomonas sp.]|uniref:glycosyltransferase family 2 protein n=1 Tax=uncultured Selenomonas sp. TaxID=159275 RepID=UPI002596129A|nr:glycosyltransferase [uncultured Selenomonas sp.]
MEQTVRALCRACADGDIDPELVVVASAEEYSSVQHTLAGVEGIAFRSVDTHSLGRLYNAGAGEMQEGRILFLREGVLLHTQGLRLMLNALAHEPQVGAVGAFSDRTTYEWQYLNATHIEAAGDTTEAYLHDHVEGAAEGFALENFALLMRRETFVQTGGFSEEFPAAGGEDIDLSFRLKFAGYRLLRVPGYFHHAGAEVCDLCDLTRTLARPILLARWGLDIGIPETIWRDALAAIDFRQGESLVRATCRSALLTTPLVSIMIPTYNRPEYFRETLESARAQTYPNIEIIVCDNGTDDRTEELMRNYRDDLRIRYVRNRAAKTKEENFMPFERLARGEYLQWCMDDDILLPDKLTLMADTFLQYPKVTLVTSRRGIIDENGDFLKQWDVAPPLSGVMNVLDGQTVGWHLLMLTNNFIGEPSAVLFRRSDLMHHYWNAESRGYRAISDCAMWLELLERGDFAMFSRPLSLYRNHLRQEAQQADVFANSFLEWFYLMADYRCRGVFLTTEEDYQKAVAGLKKICREHVAPMLHYASPAMQEHYRSTMQKI